jgi:hypothetical protein
MYKLVRVEDHFQVVEGSASGTDPSAHPAASSDRQEAFSNFWNPRSQLEKQFWDDFVRTGTTLPSQVRSAIL